MDISTREGSAGHECIEWCEKHLGIALLPWQKWFLIHALELNPDGSFRFSTVLLLVSRQNGKTAVVECLTAWMMLTRPDLMVLGTSTAQELAREPWARVADHCEALGLAASIKRGSIDTSIRALNGSRYKVAAATRRGGRSLSVDVLVLDELREMLDDWEAYNALSGTTTARAGSFTLALSNAGDVRSVVLNGLREVALEGSDPETGIFEWSAPEGCDLDDAGAVAQANPALGETITVKTLASKRRLMPEVGFRTEHMCQRVGSVKSTPGEPVVTEAEWMARKAVDAPQGHGTTVLAVEGAFSEGLVVVRAHRLSERHVWLSCDAFSDVDAVRAHLAPLQAAGAVVLAGKSYASRLVGAEPMTGTARQAMLDLRAMLSQVEHDGSEELTAQVLAMRAKGGSGGPRLVSTHRVDAVKAAVWAAGRALEIGEESRVY